MFTNSKPKKTHWFTRHQRSLEVIPPLTRRQTTLLRRLQKNRHRPTLEQVVDEARRQGLRLTDYAAGAMMQAMKRTVPMAVAHCAKRRIKR